MPDRTPGDLAAFLDAQPPDREITLCNVPSLQRAPLAFYRDHNGDIWCRVADTESNGGDPTQFFNRWTPNDIRTHAKSMWVGRHAEDYTADIERMLSLIGLTIADFGTPPEEND
jgi:hypothetical protein